MVLCKKTSLHTDDYGQKNYAPSDFVHVANEFEYLNMACYDKVDPTPFDTGLEATLDMFDAPTETAKNPIPMLYQSGYLTIKSSKPGSRFVLGFPNDEVRLGFLKALKPYYAMDDACRCRCGNCRRCLRFRV